MARIRASAAALLCFGCVSQSSLDGFALPDEARRDEVGVLTAALRRMRDSLKEHIELRAANLAAQARLDHELQIAASIQQAMLPKAGSRSMPAEVRIAASLVPTKQVGGDAYDYLTQWSNWTGSDGLLSLLFEQLLLTITALAIAMLIGLPIALYLGHVGRGGFLAINISNIGRAVPTFAVLVLLSVGFVGTDYFGPYGRAGLATLIALVLFALPPVVTNEPGPEQAPQVALGPGTTVEEAERRLIMMTLQHTRDNKTRAAEILGISLKTLHNKLNKLRLRPNKKAD